jgi:hypothetical protein
MDLDGLLAGGECHRFGRTAGPRTVGPGSLGTTGGGVSLYGLPAVEAVARFEGGVLRQVTVVFYARGDAGNLSKTDYEALVKRSAEVLDRISGV